MDEGRAGSSHTAGTDLLLHPPARPGAKIPSVDWWITSRCNLACDFCYGPTPGKDPTDRREAILSALEASSATAITFCGGEPLLVREIGAYARRLADGGKRTVLNTNGSLLTRRVDQGMDFPFAVVGLSLDGSTDEVHRAMRGTKADWGQALRAAEWVAGSDASLKLATVVSRVNRHDLPALADLVKHVNPTVWRLYQYSARGDQNVGQARHVLAEDEFRELAEMAARRAAPVPTAPSPESLTAGCLIVDPAGSVLEPTADGYVRRGSCLDEPIDEIWARIPSAETVVANKQWLSMLEQAP